MSERKPRIQRENISPATSVILISQGDSLSMVLRDDEAGAIMHELDALLHPWGEPGVVPTEHGEYWVWMNHPGIKPVRALRKDGKSGPEHLRDRVWWWDSGALGDSFWSQEAMCHASNLRGWQFRRCWLPAIPEVKR